MAREAKPKPEVAILPEPDRLERRAIKAALERNKARVPPVAIKLEGGHTPGKPLRLGAPHADTDGWVDRLSDTFGTWSSGVVSVSLGQLSSIAGGVKSAPTSDELNAALAFVHAVGPKNEMEAALAVQMWGAHELAAVMLVRAASSERVDHVREFVGLATKLQRTFTGQIEALAKLRRGGEQVVRHIHVNVDNRGGQAVIAENVTTGGGEKNDGQPYGSDDAVTVGPALLGQDAAGHGMPIPCNAERPVPHPRRKVARCATG